MPASKTPAMITELLDLDAQLAELQERRDTLAADLIDRLGIGGSIETEDALVTVVQSTTDTVDFDALVAAHPTWARKVTKKVLNQAKFNFLRKAGEVPPDVLALVKTKLSSPYLRVTKR